MKLDRKRGRGGSKEERDRNERERLRESGRRGNKVERDRNERERGRERERERERERGKGTEREADGWKLSCFENQRHNVKRKISTAERHRMKEKD